MMVMVMNENEVNKVNSSICVLLFPYLLFSFQWR